MTGYHVTTPRKLARYKETGAIMPPVRFWPDESTARRWALRTGRTVICVFERTAIDYPLPDHRPARFTDALIREYEVIDVATKNGGSLTTLAVNGGLGIAPK